jgi:hypothetical protein
MPNRAIYSSGPYRDAAYRRDAYQPASAFRPSGVDFSRTDLPRPDRNGAGPLHLAQGAAHYPVPYPPQPNSRQHGVPWGALLIVHLVIGWIIYMTGPLLFSLMFG